MRCPFCGEFDSKVTNSRSTLAGTRRRRECLLCGMRFTTYEKIHASLPVVVKADGRREPYDADKLKHGILLACKKRKVSIGQIDRLLDEIGLELLKINRSEVKSRVIGGLVMGKLAEVDKVAYVRFASIYEQFSKVSSFVEAAKEADGLNEHKNQIEMVLFGDKEPPQKKTENKKIKPSTLVYDIKKD